MKILFTGGGTGGHFYPIIAVADSLNSIADQEKIIKLELSFMSESPYDQGLLTQKGIQFKQIPSGKIRRYFSVFNFTDIFKTIAGVFKAGWVIYSDFPDVVFSKGGFASFPVLVAARFFGIPVIIHESDVAPGKVNKWSGKFAKRVAISFFQSAKYFPQNKTALTGNPVRRDFFLSPRASAKDFLNLEENVPVVLVIGGSQGAKFINDIVLDALPEMVKKYQIIHQCGKLNFKESEGRSRLQLEKSPFKTRYHLFSYLDFGHLRMAYGAADLVVSRAGSGSIFEIAASGLPSILVPLPGSAQEHQRENAYAYAGTGAANIIEQQNLSAHILISEIDNLLSSPAKVRQMAEAAKKFAKPDAAQKIAREIINLALSHA